MKIKLIGQCIMLSPPSRSTMFNSNIHPFIHSFIHSFACAECHDSLLFSGSSSISLCCVLFPSILFHQVVFHLSSLLVICFLVSCSVLFPHSYKILFWEFYFLLFSVHAQTKIIYLAL